MEQASVLLLPVDKPQSLKDLSYSIIKTAIQTLKFKPGQVLSHREPAAQLEISEAPIRDALRLAWLKRQLIDNRRD